LVFRQSEALEQTQLLLLEHRIMLLDEPGQQHPLLMVPWGPWYLLRRRMISHQSLLGQHHQLFLPDLGLQLLELVHHPLLVRR
jgi:hypothetical protein